MSAKIPRDIPRWMYEAFQRMHQKQRQNEANFTAIGRGEMPGGSGDPLPFDLSGYFKLAGRPGGQIGHGDTETSGTLKLSSTFSDTKGFIYLGDPTAIVEIDEAFGYVGINRTPAVALDVKGTANATGTTILPSVRRLGGYNNTGPGAWAPGDLLGVEYYYTGAGTPVAGTWVSAITSNDGTGSFIAINVGGPGAPNGANPSRFTLDAPIVPGATYEVTVSMFTEGVTCEAGTYQVLLVDSNGDVWPSAQLNIAGLTTTPTTHIFTVVCGSPNSSGGQTDTPDGLAMIAGGTINGGATGIYICCSYVAIVGMEEDIQHWHDSDDNLLAIVDPNGQFGIGVTTNLLAMLHIVPDSSETVGQTIQGAASQSADLEQFRNSAGTLLSGFTAAGAYYLLSGAGTGKVLTSDSLGVGAWASCSTLATRVQYDWRANGPYIVMTEMDGVLRIPSAFTITSVYLRRKTAGTSGSTIIDLNKNGTTMFTTQANRPTVTAAGGSNQSSSGTLPDVTSVAAGDLLSIDIDAVEGGTPSDFVLIIEGA